MDAALWPQSASGANRAQPHANNLGIATAPSSVQRWPAIGCPRGRSPLEDAHAELGFNAQLKQACRDRLPTDEGQRRLGVNAKRRLVVQHKAA